MACVRKTTDEYEIQQYAGDGWETVCTETSRADAKARLRESRENQPEFAVCLVKKRVPLAQGDDR